MGTEIGFHCSVANIIRGRFFHGRALLVGLHFRLACVCAHVCYSAAPYSNAVKEEGLLVGDGWHGGVMQIDSQGPSVIQHVAERVFHFDFVAVWRREEIIPHGQGH